MTRFIDVHDLSQLVTTIGIRDFLGGMTDALHEDFVRWLEFDKSPRAACHSDIGVIELMPVADAAHYGFKYVNGHPANTARGLSTVMAFGAYAEVATGYPLLLSELTLTTAFRTAATSAMAARALARPDAKSMALIGCGAQSEFQALAFHLLLGIDEIRVYDVHPKAIDKLLRNLSRYTDLTLIKARSTADAVAGADIVTTATADKSWATIIESHMVEPGMHINAIGGDCPGKTEIAGDVLRGGKIFVEYEPQTRVEGDIQQLAADHPVHDLWRVLADQTSGRDDAQQVTIFDSVGFALEDFSALRFLYHKALELNVGKDIALVPALDDPKDLFQLALDASGKTQVTRAA